MVKKVLAAVVVLLVMVSGAWAVELWNGHYSLAGLTDGKKPDYSDARFNYLDFTVGDTGVALSQENASLTGTINLSGGNYSFWNGTAMQKVSGTPMSYRLVVGSWLTDGEDIEFATYAARSVLRCTVEADNGLNGVTATWNIPNMPSLNGSLVLPNYLTAKEQLENHIVYFDFIDSDDYATGINWRVAKTSAPDTPLTLNVASNFFRFRVWNFDGERIINLRTNQYNPGGNVLAGRIDFETPIRKSDIWHVRTGFSMSTERDNWSEDYSSYYWDYYVTTKPEMTLWNEHVSEASLVNGKSDYSNAKFSDIFFETETANRVMTDSRHFTNAGRMTVPGGGYTLKDFDTGETLSTVASGTDRTFSLRNYPGSEIGDTYLEYEAIDDSGRLLQFAGDAETSLPGKTITWTFPDELNMNGSGVIKNFKTTAQQLASGVPYIEVVSKDGYITALNYKIVTASDTTTAINPGYRTNFNFRIYRSDVRFDLANSYNAGTVSNSASGTFTLELPQPVSTMKRLRVRMTSYEEASNPKIYQWNFYPSSSQGRSSNNRGVNNNSGGCNSLGIMAALALVLILSKKR